MNLTKYLPHGLGALLAGALVFTFWLWRHDAAVKAQAVHDVQVAAVEARNAAVDSVTKAIQPRLDSLVKDSARLAQREASYRIAFTGSRKVADSLRSRLDSALATIPDTVRIAITSAFTADSQAIHSCSLALTAADSLNTVCGQRLAATNHLLALTREALDSSQAALKVVAKATHPSIFGQVRSGLPWLAAGVLAGIVLKP